MTTSITTPTPEQEHPRAGVSIAVAVVCFGIGVAAVIATSGAAPRVAPQAAALRASPPRVAPPRHQEPTAEQRAAAKPRATDGAPRIPPVRDVVVRVPLPRGVRASAVVGDPTSAIPTNSVAGDAVTLIPGRVAYLRCDGLTGELGRFPCPRDLGLEQSVWAAFGGLTTCHPALGRGTADVRLHFSRNRPSEASVTAIAGSPEPALDRELVYACVGSALTNVKTRLDPLYMVVSFRVALR